MHQPQKANPDRFSVFGYRDLHESCHQTTDLSTGGGERFLSNAVNLLKERNLQTANIEMQNYAIRKANNRKDMFGFTQIIMPSTAYETNGNMTKLFKIISDHYQNANIASVQRKYFNETKGEDCLFADGCTLNELTWKSETAVRLTCGCRYKSWIKCCRLQRVFLYVLSPRFFLQPLLFLFCFRLAVHQTLVFAGI